MKSNNEFKAQLEHLKELHARAIENFVNDEDIFSYSILVFNNNEISLSCCQ